MFSRYSSWAGLPHIPKTGRFVVRKNLLDLRCSLKTIGVHSVRRHLWKAEPVAVSKAEGRGREGAGSPAITQFTPPPPLFVRFVLRSTNGQRGRRAERERERRTDGRTDEESEKPAASTHTLRT